MKKPIIFHIALMVTIAIGCTKPGYNDLSGNMTISGKVYFFDTLSGGYSANPIPGLTVYVSDSSDPTNYLYPDKSDVLGNFSFSGLNSKQSYIIHTSLDSSHEYYSGQIFYHTFPPPAANTQFALMLTPDQTLQNGIFMEASDAGQGRLANAQLYFFASNVLATSADTAYANFRLTTDVYGRCLKLNIANGSYTVLGFDALGRTPPLTGTTAAPIHVNMAGISSGSIILQ
jgi:hypothetical protein